MPDIFDLFEADTSNEFDATAAPTDYTQPPPPVMPEGKDIFDLFDDGVKTPGNIDLSNRPRLKNPDGSTSTVRSMSIGTDEGEVLLPTVGPNGEDWSPEQAIGNYKATGQHLGVFYSPEAATKYAQQLHEQQAQQIQTPQPAAAQPAAAQPAGDLFDAYDPATDTFAAPTAATAAPAAPAQAAQPAASDYEMTPEGSEAAFAAIAQDPNDHSTVMGSMKALGRGMAEGLTTELPLQIGKALEFATERGQKNLEEMYKDVYNLKTEEGRRASEQLAAEGKIPNFGKHLADWAEEKNKEWWGGPFEASGTVEKMLYEGSKMLAPSVIPGGVLNLGLRTTLGVGRAIEAATAAAKAGQLVRAAALMQEAQLAAKLASTMSSAGVSAIFGLSQAQDTKDTALQKAAAFEKAGNHAEAEKMRQRAEGWAPWVSGGIEAVGEYFGTKYLGKMFGLSEAEVVKRGVKNILKDFFKSLGVEIGTEVGQQYGEASVEKYSGIRPEAKPLAEALNVIGPTAVMTILTLGLASGANLMTEPQAKPEGEAAPEEAKPETHIKIKGAVEPVPGETGLGFKPTKDTTIDVVDAKGKSVLPPKAEEPIIEDLDKLAKEAGEEGAGPPAATPERKKAMTGYIEAMFDDLTKDEITYIRDTTQDPVIKELITERLDTGKIALGEESHPKEAAAAPKAAEPVVAAVKGEKPIEIPAGQGDSQSLPRMAALIRDSYLPDLKDTDIRPPSQVTEEQKVVHQLADIWKIKSTFYSADENILPGGINGLADQDNRQIFINEKAAAPALFVLGHESFHILEKEHPDLWQKAMDVIREEAANLPEYKALLAKNREAAGTGKEKIDEDLVRREFGSDVSGQVFTRPTFWKKLNQRNPEIFKALADIVRRLLLQVKRALKGGTKAHNAVVKNMERVEKAIADAYAEAARRDQKVATEERTTKVTVPTERRKSNEKTRKQFEAYRDMLGDTEKARELFDELIGMVYTDDLMGIGSKRAFFEALAEDHEKPAEEWRTVTMVDLDNFSWFNDALGHPLGDELLAAVGKTMQGLGVDVYRVGGEELALLTEDEAAATQAVNQLRRELEDRIVIEHTIGTDVELKDGTTYKQGEKLTIKGVGISYGIGKTYKAADEELKLDKGFRTAQGIRAAKGAEAKRVSRVSGAAKGTAAKEQGKKPGAPAAVKKETPKLSVKGTFTVKAEKYAERRGETGPFHNTWRVYDAAGNRLSLIFTSKESAEAYVKKLSAVQKKAMLSVKSKAFKKWFGKSVVKEDGEPLMVFHGTTSSSVTEFATGATGRVMEWENFLGPGAYFTSSVDDANENYATDMGPDITSKIEKAKEDYGNLEDYDPNDPRIREVLSDFLTGVTPSPWSDLERTAKEIPEQAGEELGQEFADLDAVLDDEAGLEWVREHFWEEAIDAQVRADLTPDNQGALMPVFLKMENPLDLSETKLGYELEYSEDGEDIIGESGPALEMIDEITGILQGYDANPDSIDRLREGLMEKAMSYEEITGDDILEAMGEAEIYDISADDGYSLVSAGAILREAAENLGYDGIIMDAHKYFGPRRVGTFGVPGMKGLFQDTRHYLPFKPNQIKSAIGNVGTYTADSNILLSVKNYDDIEDKKNWSNVAEAAEKLPEDLEFTSPVKTTDAGVKGLKAMTAVRMATTGSLKAKNLYAKTPAEAASVLAHIRKSPQENLYTITVDKKGKILEIHRYTKGVSTSANMKATDIVGYVAGVKGATRVYVAHNHPSKTASPSREDIIAMSAISNGLDLADIEVVPLIVAGTKWVPVRVTPVPIAEQIPGVVRKKKIPIRERTFSLQAAGPKSSNSKEAYKNKVDLFGEKTEGFMLANSQLEAVGFYELPKGESLGAAAIGLMRAFERTNANSVFFYGNESLNAANNRENLLMYLRKALGTDLPIHDVFTKDVSLRDTQPNHPAFTGTFEPAVGYSALKVGGPVFSVKKKEVPLAAKVTAGKEGVTRIAYTEGKKTIGSARLMGTTIGDIEVAEKYRKKGYGKKILRDLRDRGGRMLYAVNDASRALAKSAGMLDIGDGRFEFPKNMVAPAAPPFKKWFGDSKVVDAAGNPRVMYHSTTSPEDFGTFERGASDIGIHFGTKEQANDRIKFRSRFMTAKQMEGQRLYPVYLKIENPLRTYDAGAWDPNNVPSALLAAKAITKEEYNELRRWEDEQTQLEIEMEGSGDDLTEALENLQEEFADDVVRRLESKGYDGIVYKNKGEIEGMAEIMFRMDAAKTDAERSAIYKEKAALEESDKAQDSYIVFHPNQIKSVWNRGTFDTAKGNILLSVKRMQMMAEPTDEQIKNMGPDAYMIGQVGDPHLLFSVPERMAAQKWDPINFEESQYSILNGRIVRELTIFETLFGPSEKAIEVPGVGKKPARGIRTYDLMSELFRVIESGEAADIFNRAVDPKKLADAKKLSTKSPGKTAQGKRILSPSEEYIRLVEVMRSGALMSSIDEANVKDTLGNNAKAGRSFDLMLALCDPTEQCRFCYAAKIMLRQATVEKAVRNTFHILMDPIGWARKAAAEAAAFNRPDLPFIRLQGSGDFTTGPQLKGYNALARYADRPIHIFSRHHEMLRKLVGTPKAPFIKSGSLDATLYDYYGHKYVVANAQRHGIANSWLYTSTQEIETLEKLYSEEALGLILAVSPKLHLQLPPHLRTRGCPCDAEERYFVSSCRECALSMFGCMTAFRQKGIDNKGKVWSMADPKRPKTIAPMLAFMKGANAMTVADFIMKKAKETGGEIMKKAEKLAFIERAARELGIDPLQVEYSPEVQGYLDVSLTLIDDSIKKTLKQVRALEAKEKDYAMLYDRRFPGDEIKTLNLQVAKDHIDWLRWLRDQALMGKAYLTGGEIQKPVALKNGEILAAPELFDKNTAKNLLFSVKTARGFDPDQVREANASGAGEAKLSAVVKSLAKEGERILNFGSGRHPDTKALTKAGMEVSAYEFGNAFDVAAHDGEALSKRYDVTYAENVANVQTTPSMFKRTVAQMSQTVSRKGGRLVVNMPAAPRKGFLGRMTHAQATELLRRELREIFTDVEAYRDKDGKRDREILVASGKRSVALSVKLAADRVKGSEDFQKWFADSDLKNADGSPMVLYHGTSRDFSQFSTVDPKRLLDQIAGFHVAADPSMAADFTGHLAYDPVENRGPTGGRIMPLFVRGKVHVVEQVKEGKAIEEDWHAVNRLIFDTVMKEDPDLFREWFKKTFWKYEKDFKNVTEFNETADKVWRLLNAGEKVLESQFDGLENARFATGHSSFGQYCTAWGGQAMQLGFDGRMRLIRKFRKIMVDRGITSLQYHNTVEGQKDKRAYVVLDPTAIKSIWNRGTYETTQGNIMLSTKNIEWARAMNQHLEKNWPETATAEHFYQLADTWAKKGAFKTEELEWSGLAEWAEGLGKKKVSKTEAMAALLDTQFQIEEVVYHNESPEARQAVINNALDDIENAVRYTSMDDQAREALWEEFEEAKSEYLAGRRDPLDDFLAYLNDNMDMPVDRLVIYESHAEARPSEGMTRHDDYQVEGWSNYHELVMTAPMIGKKEWDLFAAHRQETLKAAREDLDRLKKKYGITHMLTLENVPLDDAREMRRLEYEIYVNENAQWGDSDTKIGTFRYEPHWDELKNPLVHLRFNDRIDADGRRVMFIEELQSDWHQQGRDHGYTTGLNVVMRLLDAYPKLPRDPGEWSINKLKEAGVSEEDIDAWHDARMKGAVPDAPFKSTTAWTTLGLKRAVRWAVEHGYDRIAWTPGLVQVERYKHKISQMVDQITVEPWAAGGKLQSEMLQTGRDAAVFVQGFKNGEQVFGEEMAVEGKTSISGKDYSLEQVIGKEMAGKVRADAKKTHEFKGDELTIGGHGMRAFYDQIMVAAANKMFNKEAFGKAKVTTTKIDTGEIENDIDTAARDEAFLLFDAGDITREERNRMIEEASHETTQKLEVWSLDVTDQMREKAKDLPLFSIKVADVQPAKSSVYLRNYLEAVATPEALKALSLREAGIPFWHEFYDRHAANGRATIKDIKRLYTDLYGPPEKVKIGRHEVMIGSRKSIPMLMVKAYHGSRDFDQFSIDYVGTGEKAQAFGWGLYFTDLKSVARHYAKKIGGRYSYDNIRVGDFEVTKAGELVKSKAKWAEEKAAEKDIRFAIRDTITQNASAVDVTNPVIAADLIDFKLSVLKERMIRDSFGGEWDDKYTDYGTKLIDKILADIKEIGWKDRIQITSKKARTIYAVTLFKDKDPSEYKFLDWQEQLDKKTLNTLKAQAEKENLQSILKLINETIEELDAGRMRMNTITSNFYNWLVGGFQSAREASMFLLRSGIQGIRYPAGSISGGVKPRMVAKIDGKEIKLTKWAENALRIAQTDYGVMRMTLNKVGIRLEAELDNRREGITPEGEAQTHKMVEAAYAGTLTYEKVEPQNYVVFDDSVISIEKKYQFSVKNDPEIRPIAMEYLKMLEATVPGKPAKSAGAAAATAKISEDLLGQLREEVRVRMKAAEGIPVPKFIDKGKKGILSSWHSFTRSFADLDSRNFGDVTDLLRLHREAPDNAVRRAMDVMVNLLDGLDHNQYTAFRMKLIMDDMVKDIESGLLQPDAAKGETFPFGFADVTEVKAFHKTVTDAVAGDAKVDSAIRRRTRFNHKLKELLVKHNLLDEKVLDDDRYFHHQVLEYRAMTSLGDEYFAGAGLGQKALQYKKKGWQLARKGSLKDYNSDYAQAEYEVIAQAFMQLETKATLERLRKVADFTPKAKAMAVLHESATGEKKDWKEFIPDTHIPWKPMPNSAWYKASTITDRILDKVLAGDMVLGPEHIKEMFVKGRDKEWYIPRELAKTLNEFGGEFNDKFWMAKLSNALQSRWKAWTLISPLRIIKYNVNNMSGDADIAFAYSPLIFKHFPKALKDLSIDKWSEIKDADLKKELEMAKRLGVIGSGWSVQELTQVTQKLGDVKALKALFETPSLLQKMMGAPKGAAKGYWEFAKNITEVRENILRLAAFRHFLKEIAAGKTVYAASKKSEIDKITDPYEKAAKLSRELVGDYGNISQAGRWLRRHLIPFWSWCEVNAPRYVRLIANVRHEGQGGTAGTVARALAGTTAKLGLKGTILGAKLAALAVLINVFNHTFFPDEEDELTDSQRRQLHLILGRRKDGSVISLRIQGALSDAMAWFGAEDIVSDIRDYRSGRKSAGDWAKEAALATPVKLFGGLRPEPKMAYELLTEKSLYPDPGNPRAIRDRWEYVARVFSLNVPYLWLTGRPQRGGDLGAQLINNLMSLGLYSSDPGESAYYNTMSWAYEYLDKMGEDKRSFSPNAKSNYLYWYKQGLKYGDLKAAEKYLKLYAEEGGTPKQMAASVKRAHPLNMIPSKFRAGFQESLSPEQLVTLERAINWYFNTYQGPNRDAIPFPEPRSREAMTLRKFKLGG